MNLNFKISELVYSDTAIKNNISNMPDLAALDNLLNLIVYCLQPVREKLNKPMIITSGFRSDKLNQKLSGAVNSQHKTGQAADFKVVGMTPFEIINIIKNSNIEYDQLINEYNKWVHISFNKNKNRRQILKFE